MSETDLRKAMNAVSDVVQNRPQPDVGRNDASPKPEPRKSPKRTEFPDADA